MSGALPLLHEIPCAAFQVPFLAQNCLMRVVAELKSNQTALLSIMQLLTYACMQHRSSTPFSPLYC
jgi:hypothetical protein